MKKRIVLGILMVVTLAMAIGDVYGGDQQRKRSQVRRKSRVNTKWEKHADKNEDGRVDRKEAKDAKEEYLEKRSEVDRKWEERADRNDDGTIDENELKDWRNFKKRKVNNSIEKKYDADGDGFISKEEAKTMYENRKEWLEENRKAKEATE